MKVGYVSDFFVDEIYGGAEIVDDIIIKSLSTAFEVHKIKSSAQLIECDFYILSNFTRMPESTKQILYDKDYAIIEHDHKYLKTRNPSVFKDYIAPADQITNLKIYRNAKQVFCQSKKQADVLINNLIIDNVSSFGCSFWSDEEINILRQNCNNTKTNNTCFIEFHNPIKGSFKCLTYCKSKDLDYTALKQKPFAELMKDISEYESFVFFPKVLESFSRIALEARMLNCKLITNNLLGCRYEDWFANLKGEQLIDFVEDKMKTNINSLINFIKTGISDLSVEGLQFPKVSLITSMFKGEKYITKFLNNMVSQTVFKHCELLIIDAVSPENEFPIIKKYMDKYPNIKYTRLEEDPGIYGVWNIGAKMATGKYLTNTNLDDIRSPDQIEVMVNCLEKNPDIDLAYSESYVTNVGNETFENNSSGGKTYPITDFSKPAMIKCLPGCMPVWRKTMHDKAGYFDESFRYAGDHELWLRAVRNGCEFKRVKGAHGLYYMNPDGLSTSQANAVKRYKEEQLVFWEYTDIFGNEVVNRYKGYFSNETV